MGRDSAIMRELACTVLYQSTSPHLTQLYTGLLLLHKQGFLRLTQRARPTPIRYDSIRPHLRDAGHAHLDVVLEDTIRLHVDTHDSEDIALGELDECDFYFKRSYSPQVVRGLPAAQRRKILALGLNYCVVPDGVDLFAARRGIRVARGFRAKVHACRQALALRTPFSHDPNLSALEHGPDFDAEPRVLFFVAAYDPYDDPNRSQDKFDERISINETRARCIRALREALGDRFTGGFIPSAFAVQHYPDLIADREATTQRRYFAGVRAHPICVATTGLHGSTGWKLAEYVAFARAILTEKLAYRVPGDFCQEQNYVEFATPEECAAASLRLVEDHSLRQRLMLNNASYYRRFLRPDSLVRNAIDTALSLASARTSTTSLSVVRDPERRHLVATAGSDQPHRRTGTG
jgi:hypothetical protein